MVVAPLTNLLKEALKWDDSTRDAFNKLKKELSSAPKQFEMEVDASNIGIGVVLMQEKHPVAFVSKVLSPHNRLLSLYVRELLALVYVVSKWHQYCPSNCVILTDRQSLKYLLEQRLSTLDQYKWVTKFIGLQYEIRILVSTDLWQEIQQAYTQDASLQKLKQQLENGTITDQIYNCREGVVLRKDKMIIPRVQHIKKCYTYLRCKYEPVTYLGLLQPLPIPKGIWHSVAIDFIEKLSISSSKDTVWVIIDRLSKYTHFIPLAHPFNAAQLAQIFLKEIYWLHKAPTNIAYHPQSDGQSEVLNWCLEHYLHSMVWQNPNKWTEWWYYTTYHTSIGMTPYEVRVWNCSAIYEQCQKARNAIRQRNEMPQQPTISAKFLMYKVWCAEGADQ
ncbi:hypothetical protein CR513_03095, partial [Mucuna pruriens]